MHNILCLQENQHEKNPINRTTLCFKILNHDLELGRHNLHIVSLSSVVGHPNDEQISIQPLLEEVRIFFQVHVKTTLCR